MAVKLEIPVTIPVFTVNMMCGSGMHTALLAANAIRAGEAQAILAGGTESMSQSPLLVSRAGKGQSPDLATAVDSMQREGLVDSFSHRHMGEQAEQRAHVPSPPRSREKVADRPDEHPQVPSPPRSGEKVPAGRMRGLDARRCSYRSIAEPPGFPLTPPCPPLASVLIW